MILQLPIFHHTDATSALKSLALDYNLEDAEIRPITFYHINAVSQYIEGEKEYSSIHANASEYTCPHPYKQIQDIVAKAKKSPDTMIDLYTAYKKNHPE